MLVLFILEFQITEHFKVARGNTILEKSLLSPSRKNGQVEISLVATKTTPLSWY